MIFRVFALKQFASSELNFSFSRGFWSVAGKKVSTLTLNISVLKVDSDDHKGDFL
jgi:hypothetical protein